MVFEKNDFEVSQINLCKNCFVNKNYPIFYNQSDFSLVRLMDLYRNKLGDIPLFKFSLTQRCQLIECLNQKFLEETTLKDICEQMSLEDTASVAVCLLSIIELFTNNTEIPEIYFSPKKIEFSERLENVLHSTEKQLQLNQVRKEFEEKEIQEGLSEDAFHGMMGEIQSVFRDRVRKSEIFFDFCDEFEKIIYQEDKNLKLFN